MQEQEGWNPQLIEEDTKEVFCEEYSWEEVLILSLSHIVVSYEIERDKREVAERCKAWSESQGVDLKALSEKTEKISDGLFYNYLSLHLSDKPELAPEGYRNFLGRRFAPWQLVEYFLSVEGLE